MDGVLDKKSSDKVLGNVRTAYQYDIEVEFNQGVLEKVVPYTFEDALALSNIDTLKKLNKPTGMMKKMKTACEEATLNDCAVSMYKALDNNGKAKMALDIIFDIDPKDLKVPFYINEGLEWLQDELKKSSKDFVVEPLVVDGEANDE